MAVGVAYPPPTGRYSARRVANASPCMAGDPARRSADAACRNAAARLHGVAAASAHWAVASAHRGQPLVPPLSPVNERVRWLPSRSSARNFPKLRRDVRWAKADGPHHDGQSAGVAPQPPVVSPSGSVWQRNLGKLSEELPSERKRRAALISGSVPLRQRWPDGVDAAFDLFGKVVHVVAAWVA